MIILIIMLVAVLAFVFGFISGYTVEIYPKTYKKQTIREKNNTQIQKEYENFLNYDGTVQE